MSQTQQNETSAHDELNKQEGEIFYQGFAVPKALRIIYAIFFTWLFYYFFSNLLPNLSAWFSGPYQVGM